MKHKLLKITTFGFVIIALMVGMAAMQTRAADHLDAPAATSPGGDGRLDINDVYAFQAPNNPANTVLIVTVSPAAGILSPTTFHPNAKYDLNIDNDGDGRLETRFRVTFSKPDDDDDDDGDGGQEFRLYRKYHGRIGKGNTGETTEIAGGAKIYAGLFDDPFFFDLAAFRGSNGRTFCDANATNFFNGLNTLAIVLEIPSEWLGANQVGVWATTQFRGQVDRMGRPAINTVFIPANPFEPNEPSQKNFFNRTKPHKDQERFRAEVVDNLALFYPAGDPTIDALADILLPDILTYDATSSAGFLNGRQLANDVIDAELGLVTNNIVTSDCVDANELAFNPDFPYLAAPNP